MFDASDVQKMTMTIHLTQRRVNGEAEGREQLPPSAAPMSSGVSNDADTDM